VSKFLILLFSLALLPVLVNGQTVSAGKINQLTTSNDGELMATAVSPAGNLILATSPGYTGLKVIDVAGKSIKIITNHAGAGYEPKFSADGKTVYFRSDEYSEMKKYSSLHAYNLQSGETKLLEIRSRDLSPPSVAGNMVFWSAAGTKKVSSEKPTDPKSDDQVPYIMLENLAPVLYSGGKSKPLTPNGSGYYIWASLSPDKSGLLYNFNGTGTFVCDTTGNIIASAGRLNAPSWLNNNIIIGMDDRDDGDRVISSDIIAFVPETGERINLTATGGTIEMYPVPFPDGKRVVYQTVRGELFIMDLIFKQ
jgi:Tol biopolymer transport system component